MNKKAKETSPESWVIKQERGLTESEEKHLESLEKSGEICQNDLEETQKSWDFIKEHSSSLSEELINSIHEYPNKRRFAPQGILIPAVSFGIVAIIAIFTWVTLRMDATDNIITIAQDTAPMTKRMEDGSIIRINSGSSLTFDYTDDLRLIRLVAGEAHFKVVSNAERPFVVLADQVSVTAVGTAFNVKLQSAAVNILVTEGEVEVKSDKRIAEPPSNANDLQQSILNQVEAIALLNKGQLADIQLRDGIHDISRESALDDHQIEEALSWRQPLMTFEGPTLRDLANEFQRKTGLILQFDESEISNLRIVGGAFSTNDPYSILNLLQSYYDISWEQISETTIQLTKNPN